VLPFDISLLCTGRATDISFSPPAVLKL